MFLIKFFFLFERLVFILVLLIFIINFFIVILELLFLYFFDNVLSFGILFIYGLY